MRLNANRAAALASATLFLFALAGTTGSGAFAQDQLPERAAAPATTAEPAPAEQIRFVAQEVVQPLPEASSSPAAQSLRALVADMPADAPLSRDLRCLASAIYYEARGETLEGQLAVGQVIVNRAESGRFPQDYCGVVRQRGQFSFVSGGTIPTPPAHSAAWVRASAIARIAHQEMWNSAADDALFFHASHVRPAWAGRKLARARIDSHIFYR